MLVVRAAVPCLARYQMPCYGTSESVKYFTFVIWIILSPFDYERRICGEQGPLAPLKYHKTIGKVPLCTFNIVPIVCEGAPRMCTQLFDCFLLPCIWLLPLNWLLHSLHFRPVLVPLSTDYFCVCIKMTKSSTQLSCIRYVMFIPAHTYCHTHIATPTRFWLSPGQISLWIRP